MRLNRVNALQFHAVRAQSLEGAVIDFAAALDKPPRPLMLFLNRHASVHACDCDRSGRTWEGVFTASLPPARTTPDHRPRARYLPTCIGRMA